MEKERVLSLLSGWFVFMGIVAGVAVFVVSGGYSVDRLGRETLNDPTIEGAIYGVVVISASILLRYFILVICEISRTLKRIEKAKGEISKTLKQIEKAKDNELN